MPFKKTHIHTTVINSGDAYTAQYRTYYGVALWS